MELLQNAIRGGCKIAVLALLVFTVTGVHMPEPLEAECLDME